MSERHDKLAAAWATPEIQFGKLTVVRPTTHRLNVLMRRRNKWLSDEEREQTDIEALVEWLFVLSRSKEELTRLFRVDLLEWEEMLDGFMAETPDDTLKAFQEFFEGVMETIRLGGVEDAEPGKKPQEGPSHVS